MVQHIHKAMENVVVELVIDYLVIHCTLLTMFQCVIQLSLN